LIIIIFYLPWIILDSWNSNTSINFCVWLVLVDYRSQFLTSHVIFNCHAYVKWMDRIIFCKFSYFCICDVVSWGTLPTPHALRLDICNNCFEVNLTKVGFSNGGNCFIIIISLRWALARAQLVTFWSFCLCMTMASPKMRTFILAWS